MHADSQVIEQIVSQVLKQLQNGRPAARTGPSQPSNTNHTALAKPQHAAQILDVPVLTEAVLIETLSPGQQLQIGAKTVLTPTARDYLHKQRIAWTRQTASSAKSSPRAKWKALGVTSTATLRRLCEDLRNGNDALKCEWLASTDDAARQAIAAIARAEFDGMIVFTEQAARTVCLANRHSSVRAASVNDRAGVDTARQEIGANVYVIAPHGKSYFELRNLVRAITSGTKPHVPENWNP